MNNIALSGKLGWIGGVILLVIVGRLGWMVQANDLVFESDITALLPISGESWLVEKINNRISAQVNNRITILIRGQNPVQTDSATDRLADLLDQGIAQNRIIARPIDDLEVNLLSARIEAMLEYKERLIGDRSHRRIQDSVESQLNWRMDQVTRFPPSNITDPVADPLGTMEEFLAERLPGLREIQSDGLYLRVKSDIPTNLLLLELAEGEPGGGQANNSIRWIIGAGDIIAEEFDVKLYFSGIPLHAAAIKEQTTREVRWMLSVAVLFTLGIFIYVTRSIRALLISAASIVLAMAGGLVISYQTIGLPHLIGLTMATTAIGICIDFSFHFWIHVRAGMSGTATIKTIRPGLNISFLTTVISLLAVAFTSIPILARSAVFLCGALLVSWFIVLFIFPQLAGNTGAVRSLRMLHGKRLKQFAAGLVLMIICVSTVGLVLKYHTDDSPLRLGRQADNLIQADRVVRNLLGIIGQPGIYLVQTNSADSMIEAETALLESLTDDELSQVDAVSRLVIPEAQQGHNQSLFKRAKDGLDAALLKQYLAALRVPALDWESDTDKPYTLDWVTNQSWASIERNSVLVCERSICASMIRARGDAVSKLDASCQRSSECSRISLSERQLSALKSLRSSFAWALLLALGAIFVVLYFRYRNKAFRLIMVPVLASVSGVAAVAWAGMPVTVFTLAAVFPLLGLSVDYVVFASESGSRSAPTFLAIFASALTTSLSFWILSFSNTPAVQFFALPIAVGIPVAWITVQVVLSDHV